MPVYFITYTALFWVPAILISLFIFKTLSFSLKRSFWATMALIALTTTIMEYVYLAFDVWTFSEKADKLLGVWLGPAPIEEFVFWFGGPYFCLTVYLAYKKLFERNNARE